MIKTFVNRGTEDLLHGESTSAARKVLPSNLHRAAQRKLSIMNAVKNIEELRSPPGNRLEILHGDRKGFHSIRITDRWRIVFRHNEGDFFDVEICDYH